MPSDIQIVDRGRGWQLSTSRVTVQDLVPYFQQGFTYAEIMRGIPTLLEEEIACVEQFYRDHQQELDEQDRLIRERAMARSLSPDDENRERAARLERLEKTREEIKKRKQELNGDHASS